MHQMFVWIQSILEYTSSGVFEYQIKSQYNYAIIPTSLFDELLGFVFYVWNLASICIPFLLSLLKVKVKNYGKIVENIVEFNGSFNLFIQQYNMFSSGAFTFLYQLFSIFLVFIQFELVSLY